MRALLRASLALGILGVAAVGMAGSAPRIVAHRGGAALAPENSLTAFRGAVGLGADALEFDIHLTADGEPVVIHDATLERTTTGQGAVGDTTLAQLRALRLRGPAGDPGDDIVPTLDEVLDLAAPAAVELLPEIKTAVGGRRYPGIEDKVLALLRARGLAARATVLSFDETTLRRLRQLDPAQRTMLLVSPRRLERARVWATEAVRWARDIGATDLGMGYATIDARVVAAARASGLRLAAWTVNDEVALRRVLDLGVDIVISDRPDLALRLAGRAPSAP
jgi:glycerophosphoryl diester phosphodiesterase